MNRQQLLVLSALDKYIEGLGELTPGTLIPMTRAWHQFFNKWGVSPKVFVMTPTESPLVGDLFIAAALNNLGLANSTGTVGDEIVF